MLGRADRDVTRFSRGMRNSRSVPALLTGVRPGGAAGPRLNRLAG